MNTRRTTRRTGAGAALVLLATALAACGGGDTGGSATSVDGGPPVPTPPAATEFVDTVDNPWMPWKPGTEWHFVGQTADGTEKTVVAVTDTTKVVDGVTTTVVHDVVRLDGEMLEDTYDWYAQDTDGNVWYFGEDTKEYDGEKVDTSGSWEAGVDGARAGIAMEADPQVGDAYRQEYYHDEAEDEAKVLATDAAEKVPYGDLDGLVKTKDFTRLEPTADEHKFYAKGVGVVLEVSLHEEDRTELVSMTER